MDHATARLEISSESLYHPVRGAHPSTVITSRLHKNSDRPPSDRFEPYALWFFPDSKFGNWAVSLYYDKGEKELFSSAARLSDTFFMNTDVDLANHCHRVGYVFADGWPDDPALYEKTVKEAEAETAVASAKPKRKWFNFLIGMWGAQKRLRAQ